MRKYLYAIPQKKKICLFKNETCHSSERMEKWDEDDLRTPVEDKNSNRALRIISSCFPSSKYSILFIIFLEDVFIALIQILSLSRDCNEREEKTICSC